MLSFEIKPVTIGTFVLSAIILSLVINLIPMCAIMLNGIIRTSLKCRYAECRGTLVWNEMLANVE